MSEQIKITVVMDDDKLNTEKEEQKPKRILVTQDPFMTLLSVLRENRLPEGKLCGGRGECGRCAVQFLNGATIPTPLERKHFSAEELRQGYRLACIAKPRTDCVIRLIRNEEAKVPVLTKTIPLSENIDLNGQGKKQSENQTSGVMDYMIAVDLGTTTIAMQLYRLETGEVIDTYCEHNPQRSYGTDVLSRIQASCAGRREDLQRLVCESLLRGLRQFLTYLNEYERNQRDDATKLRCMCIAGNTAMEHLLLGYDVQSLGRSPFTPVNIGVQEITLSALLACLAAKAQTWEENVPGSLPVYLTPGISAFVGGDVTAGLYALRMLPGFREGEALRTQDEKTIRMQHGEYAALPETRVRLLIDLGTNGEIAITDGKRMLVTATAAGSAFEGSGESALIGTDRIALTASFLRRGILDETGLLAEPYFSEGVPVEAEEIRAAAKPGQTEELRIGNEDVRAAAKPGQTEELRIGNEDVRAAAKPGQTNAFRIRKEDIRALQMAKAAIRAGIEILWVKMGCPRMDRVYLAGGFGYELDVEAAFAIGLLPVKLRGRVEAVGNTSLAGAFLMGRELWEGRVDRRALEETLSPGTVIESINLAAQENFAALYLQYMNLEEN